MTHRFTHYCLMSAAALLLATAGALAQDAPPTGAQSCTTCHACPEPTPNDPCLLPCARPGAPAATAPADLGPEIEILDDLENLYEPVTFSHKAHAAMSETSGGCVLCHHYGPTDPIPPCSACHAEQASWDNLRQPGLRGAYHRQCMGCHREWSHEAACGECHAPKGTAGGSVEEARIDLGGAEHPPILAETTYVYDTKEVAETVVAFHHEDHADVFQIACVACHRNESCSTCHDADTKTASRFRENMHDNCAQCHASQIEGDCTFCHTEAPRPRFNHQTRTGFALDEIHGLLGCTDCHTAGISSPSRCDACHETAKGPLPKEDKESGEAPQAEEDTAESNVE